MVIRLLILDRSLAGSYEYASAFSKDNDSYRDKIKEGD